VANNDLAGLDLHDLSRAELSALLAQVKALEGRLLAKLLMTGDQPKAHDASGDRLLSCEQTAAMLTVPKAWLYQRGRKLGLAVELGTGTLRFSHAAIQAYIKSRAVNSQPAKRKKVA